MPALEEDALVAPELACTLPLARGVAFALAPLVLGFDTGFTESKPIISLSEVFPLLAGGCFTGEACAKCSCCS